MSGEPVIEILEASVEYLVQQRSGLFSRTTMKRVNALKKINLTIEKKYLKNFY